MIKITTLGILTLAAIFAESSLGAVGRTPGQFGVSAFGAAQYSIPLWAPPGPRGIQPQIALSYNSGSGVGPLGIGWSISGLGSISRCNKTYAQDGLPAAVALVTADGYCLNGSRLRLISGSYGTSGSTYQTEIADFSNVIANGTTGNGPSSFTVKGRNGLTYQYGFIDSNGNGANSQVMAAGSVSQWLLSKVIDRTGNNMVINYVAPNGTTLAGTTVPNTILWTPTSAGASTYAYKMQFNYTTNVPQSSLAKYIAGTAVLDTELLASIAISYEGTVVKDYILGYQSSTTTARYELNSVKECADATQSNCLFATSVGYQDGTLGLSGTALTATSSGAGLALAKYDLNGDGIPDLIYMRGGVTYVAFGSPTGFQSPINSGIPGYRLIGNVDRSAEDGVLTVVSNTWWYYKWNGSAFTGYSTGLAYDSTQLAYQLADINGDGLPDLISWNEVKEAGLPKFDLTVYSRFNTTSGGTVSFSSTLNTAFQYDYTDGGQLQTPDMQISKARRFDFNGDGMDDLVFMIITGNTPYYTLTTYALLSNGAGGFSATAINSSSGAAYTPLQLVNWNDDSCLDAVNAGTLFIAACNGHAASSQYIGTIVGTIDWNGDGRTDLLVANGSTLGVYLSTGTGASSLIATSIPYNSSCVYLTIDANGDGLDDLACLNQTGSNPISYYLHDGPTPDLAVSFSDGFNNSASPTYAAITQGSYSNSTDAVFPDMNFSGPLYVVSKATFNDPSAAPGATYNQTYYYSSAWMNRQGRGFEGFEEIQVTDSRNGLNDYTYRNLAFPLTGMIIEHFIKQPSTANIVFQTYNDTSTTLDATPNNQRYFIFDSNITSKAYEVSGTENGDLISTTSSNYTYDNYGNATGIVATVTDNDPGSPYSGYAWTTSTTNTTDIATNQSADLAAWCLNMLDETQTAYSSTYPGTTSVTRTRLFVPDTPSNCRIQSVVTEPTANSGLFKVTETFGFDGFGNIQTDSVTGANMPASPATRVATNNWGATGQFLISQTDPSGAISTSNLSSVQSVTFGLPDSASNPNNLTTSWTYDAFGRKSKETRPDGTSTTWTWSACTSFCGWSNSVYQIAQTAYQTNGSTAIRTDTNFFDPIDRVTEISGPTVTGSNAIVQKRYNSLGLLTQQSIPFISGSTAYQETMTYDLVNRLSTAARPISSTNSNPQTTTYTYAGRTSTVTDPYSHTKTMISDVTGALRQTKDAVGYKITRSFDAAGSLAGVTDGIGNTLLQGVTYAYGIKPFRLTSHDADLGAWSYSYDSLGERTGWTDANGQSFSMTYDALSRPLTRVEPDLYSQWAYGSTPANHDVGQIITICSDEYEAQCVAQYTEVRAYDSLGRLSTRLIGTYWVGYDANSKFLYTNSYSATTGFLSQLVYPKSSSTYALTLQYNYQYGILASIFDASDTTATCGVSCTIWTANSMNAFGQVSEETLGNGVVINRAYDPVTSWLSSTTAGVGGGATLSNQSYLQDENGNVIQRQNNNVGLTENFAYDADNRLTCTSITGACSGATIVYDNGTAGPGNITSQAGVGTYSYPTAGQPRPHAVTSIAGTFNGIANPTFAYDANGNMISRAAANNIQVMSFNVPSFITANDASGTENVTLDYGADHQLLDYFGLHNEALFFIGGLLETYSAGGVRQ